MVGQVFEEIQNGLSEINFGNYLRQVDLKNFHYSFLWYIAINKSCNFRFGFSQVHKEVRMKEFIIKGLQSQLIIEAFPKDIL